MASVKLPLREIGFVIFSAIALYMLLAILSHDTNDPSFSFTGTTNSGAVQNLAGIGGAYFADFAFYMLGAMSYIFPFILFFEGLRVLRGGIVYRDWRLIAALESGWVLVLIAGCIIAKLHFAPGAALPAGTGGIIGESISIYGLKFFGLQGLTLLSLMFFLVGTQLALGFSWIHIIEWIGEFIHAVWGHFRSRVYRITEKAKRYWKERAGTKKRVLERSTALKKEKIKRKSRKPPAIKETNSKPPVVAKQERLFDTKSALELPDLNLLDDSRVDDESGFTEDSIQAMSRLLELKLNDFGVDAQVVSVLPGPVVTRFEVQPAPGVKVQKITALAKDLARSLAVVSVRIVEVIPGKSVVGIETPNERRETVRLKEVFSTPIFQESKSNLTLALGKDIAGQPVIADVARMPHLLVAGTTGSGKSVGINAMLLSILYKATPDQVRLILVDPKMLELAVYEGIPHLLTPVVTDMKEAAHALNWCVGEMERRYQLMAATGVRNLGGLNRKISEAIGKGQPLRDPLWEGESELDAPELEALPTIVVVIDEFADMMMVVGKKVEQLIARIAQKARAAGIHLILATQRPSVDVITGLIKANIPTRISYQVSSRVDSRTILDQGGAEQLLGHGDMLYLPPGTAMPVRVHGAFVDDDEEHRLVSDWKQRGAATYNEEVISGSTDSTQSFDSSGTDEEDPLYDEAVSFVIESRKVSISSVQRRLRIGYNRAARLVETMEKAGVVSEMNTNGSREVLAPRN
ncbi:MAG: cell division protein FtsK [Gammaproteobacteria bacterium]|nr:cell division protein FtsK [Gammaproteobacteria bacterium]